MKKVCIMLGSLNGVGGTGRAVSILANHLCNKYSVKILCYDQDVENIGYEVDKRISIDSVFNLSIKSLSCIYTSLDLLNESEIEVSAKLIKLE